MTEQVPQYNCVGERQWALARAIVERGILRTEAGIMRPTFEFPGVLVWHFEDGSALNATPLFDEGAGGWDYVPCLWVSEGGDDVTKAWDPAGSCMAVAGAMTLDPDAYAVAYRARLRMYVNCSYRLLRARAEKGLPPADEVLQEALNLFAYHVQQVYGSDDGGLASLYLSGDVERDLLRYVEAERSGAADLQAYAPCQEQTK